MNAQSVHTMSHVGLSKWQPRRRFIGGGTGMRKRGKAGRNLCLSILGACIAVLSVTTVMLSGAAMRNIDRAEQSKGNFLEAPSSRNSRHANKTMAAGHLQAEAGRKRGAPERLPAEHLPAPPAPAARPGPPDGRKPNSEIYQPARTGRRLITYKRSGGRLNNQIFQFVAALQIAKTLKRTLVVPDETTDFEWTGMFDGYFGIWDLESLNAAYDIDWKAGRDANPPTPKNAECRLSVKQARGLLGEGPERWEELDRKCPDVVDLNSELLFCERQHQFCGDGEAQTEAYKIYAHIRLAPSLMELLPSRRPEFDGKGFDEMAIHSRRAGEGKYNWEVCIAGTEKTCISHIRPESRGKFCSVRTMRGNCAIWADLEYQIKSKRFLKANRSDYKFVLASDGAHDWDMDFKGQYTVANNTEWLKALDEKVKEFKSGHHDFQRRPLSTAVGTSAYVRNELRKWNQKDLSRVWGTLEALTATLLDLFSLVDSKYLLGAYYSTLSLNACYLRGMDRIYDSNMCWMLLHPGEVHPTYPPPDDVVNLDRGDRDMLPTALMNDIEHSFIRSSDGKFIAIDRYIIGGREKKKAVIAVMGDGLAPLAFEKGAGGEEIIHTNITCSYGEQRDTPASVILMKGDRPYSEYYFRRGETHNVPWSVDGDRFRTMLILCEALQYNDKLARHPPLTLRLPDDEFSLTIGSPFGRGLGPFKFDDRKRLRLVHCLSPVYGLEDPRWLVEYLEYHMSVGVEHVHIYNMGMHSKKVNDALQAYRNAKFVTRHDWSEEASGGYTGKTTYERAKWASQTDCVLRTKGLFDYALFSDLDEVAVGPRPDGNLIEAVKVCHDAHLSHGKAGCSFNSRAASSALAESTTGNIKLKDRLLSERNEGNESDPPCLHGCECEGGKCSDWKFREGQKYMVNVRNASIPARLFWTHAISRDFEEMERIMTVLPDHIMHVRHFRGKLAN